jgi:hypothetical protein
MNPQNQYGIEAFAAGADTAEDLWKLYDAIYLDDRKVNGEDLVDLVRLGPAAGASLVQFINKAGQLGKEWDDLTDEELAQLDQILIEKVGNTDLRDAIKHLLNFSVAIDRLTEQRKPNTPDSENPDTQQPDREGPALQ